MAYTPIDTIKAQKISSAYAPLVQEKLLLPALFHHQTADEFKGAQGDTISIRVPGKLPAHDYTFRNDRTNPLILDTFKERKVDITIGGNAYSAVELTDEQKDFDLLTWAKVMPMQAEAVAAHLNLQAVDFFKKKAVSPVTLGVTEGVAGNFRRALNAAKITLDKFQIVGNRYLFVGSNFEGAMMSDENLVLAQNSGDATATEAVREATLGRVAGFTVISLPDLDPNDAVATVDTGVVWYNSAPSVPNSVPYGTTTSYEGVTLRHIVDYDTMYLRDRSVVNTWYGFGLPTDVFTKRALETAKDKNGETWSSTKVVEGEFYARAVKLTLGGTNNFSGAQGLTEGTGVDKKFIDGLNKQKSATTTPAA